MNFLSASFPRSGQAAKSAVLVLAGVAALARQRLAGQGSVLAFHGLRAEDAPVGVQDSSLHLPVGTFRALCQHLAAHYHVMPLVEMATLLQAGQALPPRAVALSFDDGYASNYHLAYPILREFHLPATIFLTTGFLDGTSPLWFQQVDLALSAQQATATPASLGETLAALKALPDALMREKVQAWVKDLPASPAPAVTHPLSWDQVREMQASGLVHFGGHTHTHPILARCSIEQQRQEIFTCHSRILAELGQAPRVFAFPNGGPADFTPETQSLLAEAGFESAWTMISGRATPTSPSLRLPRYGAPESAWELEATVSGAFELLRQWKGGRA